jgi:hypothetical protein
MFITFVFFTVTQDPFGQVFHRYVRRIIVSLHVSRLLKVFMVSAFLDKAPRPEVFATLLALRRMERSI